MTNDFDQIVESHFKEKRDIFGFESIVKLIEEVMDNSSFMLEAEEAPPADGEEQVIRRPTIKITELWGKTQNGDREVMEALMRNIQGGTVKAKIQSVKDFMTNEAPAPGEGDIAKIMTYLIFLDTFASIVNDYGASVTGFLFEAFLAALFGGTSVQIDDPTQVGAAAGSLPIEDVQLAIQAEDKPTEIKPYSLKVLGKHGQVKGSFKNIVDYFLDPAEERKTDNIVYLIVIKDAEKVRTSKGTLKMGAWNGKLKFYEFVISRANFLQLIGAPKTVPLYGYAPYIHKGNKMTIRPDKNRFPPSANKAYKDEDGLGLIRYKMPDGSDIVEPITISDGDELLSYQVVGEHDVIEGAAAKLYNPEQYKNITTKFQQAGDIDRQVFQELTQTDGYINEKQWVITHGIYADDEYWIGDINLDPGLMREKAEEYTRSLNESVVKIFNAVGALTDNLNRYFIGAKDENRKIAGLEAKRDAEVLKVEVDKTIREK